MNEQETGVELMTLTKRFLGGNPVFYCFYLISVFLVCFYLIFSVISCALTCVSSDCKKAKHLTTWPEDSPIFMEEVRNQGLSESMDSKCIHHQGVHLTLLVFSS